MFTIKSSSFTLTPDEVYQVADRYLSLNENSIEQLTSDGIIVSCTEPMCGHYRLVDDIAIQFCKPLYKSMYEDMLAELQAMSDAIEADFEKCQYEDTVEYIQAAIEDDDMAQSYVGESSRYPYLWELVETRTLPIERLWEIIKDNGWSN